MTLFGLQAARPPCMQVEAAPSPGSRPILPLRPPMWAPTMGSLVWLTHVLGANRDNRAAKWKSGEESWRPPAGDHPAGDCLANSADVGQSGLWETPPDSGGAKWGSVSTTERRWGVWWEGGGRGHVGGRGGGGSTPARLTSRPWKLSGGHATPSAETPRVANQHGSAHGRWCPQGGLKRKRPHSSIGRERCGGEGAQQYSGQQAAGRGCDRIGVPNENQGRHEAGRCRHAKGDHRGPPLSTVGTLLRPWGGRGAMRGGVGEGAAA